MLSSVGAYVMSGSARDMSRSEKVHQSGVFPRRLPMTCMYDELALRMSSEKVSRLAFQVARPTSSARRTAVSCFYIFTNGNGKMLSF